MDLTYIKPGSLIVCFIRSGTHLGTGFLYTVTETPRRQEGDTDGGWVIPGAPFLHDCGAFGAAGIRGTVDIYVDGSTWQKTICPIARE